MPVYRAPCIWSPIHRDTTTFMALAPSAKPPHPSFLGKAKRRTSSMLQSKGRHIWRLHKILRHSFSAWSKINDMNPKFFCCCYFGLGVGTFLLLVHWVRNKYHHISQKLIWSSQILDCHKIDLLSASIRGLALGFFFCRGMNFSLIHFSKFIICCRLLFHIHNLLFSRIFTVCI